jgi:hypothetical protein
MLESGARVSEVLGLTARGLRMAHNPKIGIDVAAFVRNKGDHPEQADWVQPTRVSSSTAHRARPVAARPTPMDPAGTTGDDEPIFLSRRSSVLGFGIVFKRLLGNAQRHFGRLRCNPMPFGCCCPITPHTIGTCTTFRVKKVRELFGSPRARTSPARWWTIWAGARRCSRRTTTPSPDPSSGTHGLVGAPDAAGCAP